MLSRCLPPSFGSIRLTVWGQIIIGDFQDCHHPGQLGYRTKSFLHFWLAISPQCLPPSFDTIRLIIWEQMWFKYFPYGCHLRYLNKSILAVLNLYVALMSPIKFQLHPTYSLGQDVIWRISRWPVWLQSWISERNHFSKSESPPPTKFWLNPTYRSGADVVWRFSRWPPWWPSWISELNDFSNSESLSLWCPQSSFNPTFSLWGHIVWRISRWPPWRPFWILERNNFSNAFLNLHVFQMPATKFKLVLTYRLGADVTWRFPRWPPS